MRFALLGWMMPVGRTGPWIGEAGLGAGEEVSIGSAYSAIGKENGLDGREVRVCVCVCCSCKCVRGMAGHSRMHGEA